MISLKNISKRYAHKGGSVVALEPTSLEIQSGEFVAFVGSSGSGKTTLLSMLGGMLAPTTGTVEIDGISLYDSTPVERARVRQQSIGFVFQTFNLIPYLTAQENVEVPLMLSGTCGHGERLRVIDLLSRVGLETRMNHKPRELSVGQQQRVALARTLAHNPSIILADEPTGNLDPETREQVMEFFDEICQEGRTVIMVTHDPAAAARASRTVTLWNGSIVSDSAVVNLFAA